MNLKKLGRTFWVTAAVAILAMVLQGCGGDDNGVDQSMHDQTMMERNNLQMQVDALVAALGATDVAGATDEISNLQMALQDIQTALGASDVSGVQAAINKIKADLKTLQDAADARMDTDQAAKDKEMAAEARKLAVGLDADSHFGANEDELTVTAMHGEMATVAGDATTGFFGDADTAEPMFLAKYSKSLSAMNGWSGTELMSKPKNGPTDVMHVYTNVMAGESVPFTQWAAGNSDVTAAATTGAVTIATAHTMYIAAAVFSSTGSGMTAHERNIDGNNDGDLEDTEDLFRTSGTFAGASGSYTCTSVNCTSQPAGNDGGIVLTGTWTFTPNNGAMAMTADTEYQHFGWWLRKADTGYTVHVFSGSMGDAITDLGELTGTATYTGPAAGKYSIYDAGPKGGHFTAEVELKAKFGDGTDVGTISGMVDNFMGDTAGMDTWEVTLPELDLSATGGFAASDSVEDDERPVWSIDGSAGAAGGGMWSGSLYAADTGGTPQAAAGTFMAEHDDIGNMRGAFGASHEGP